MCWALQPNLLGLYPVFIRKTWSVPNCRVFLIVVLAQLATLTANGRVATQQELRSLASSVSVSAQGNVTVLYGGDLAGGVSSGSVVPEMAANNSNPGMISNTQSAQHPNKQEDNNMAFVNEYISEADVEKYGIKELNEKFRKPNPSPDWTVDHERGIYLRYLHSEREEHSNRLTYYFYWKGTPLMVTVDIDGGGGARDAEQWISYKMWRMEIPESLKPHEAQIIADLKEAFIAEKGGACIQQPPNSPPLSISDSERKS